MNLILNMFGVINLFMPITFCCNFKHRSYNMAENSPPGHSMGFPVSGVGSGDFCGGQRMIISTQLGLSGHTVLTQNTHLFHGFYLLQSNKKDIEFFTV